MFSAAHNYFLPKLSDAQNREIFGRYASAEGHGHNYRVEIEVAGEVDPRTGMVVNIVEIDRTLKADIISVLDGRFLNREIDFFQSHAPSTENITTFVRERLIGKLPREAQLVGVTVWEMDTLWASWHDEASGKPNMNDSAVTLTRMYDFCASHRLHSEHLSAEENQQVFGKCNNANGHGHNYEIEVSITGTPPVDTGMLYSLEKLDNVVDEAVLKPFDHKHLNLDLPDFAGVNPTSEMLAVIIWRRLAAHLPTEGDPRLCKVLVRETARNSFEYAGE